ncbi:MAG: hypothetical protein WDW38_008870 [Sanguina aurantia]
MLKRCLRNSYRPSHAAVRTPTLTPHCCPDPLAPTPTATSLPSLHSSASSAAPGGLDHPESAPDGAPLPIPPPLDPIAASSDETLLPPPPPRPPTAHPLPRTVTPPAGTPPCRPAAAAALPWEPPHGAPTGRTQPSAAQADQQASPVRRLPPPRTAAVRRAGRGAGRHPASHKAAAATGASQLDPPAFETWEGEGRVLAPARRCEHRGRAAGGGGRGVSAPHTAGGEGEGGAAAVGPAVMQHRGRHARQEEDAPDGGSGDAAPSLLAVGGQQQQQQQQPATRAGMHTLPTGKTGQPWPPQQQQYDQQQHALQEQQQQQQYGQRAPGTAQEACNPSPTLAIQVPNSLSSGEGLCLHSPPPQKLSRVAAAAAAHQLASALAGADTASHRQQHVITPHQTPPDPTSSAPRSPPALAHSPPAPSLPCLP